MLKDKEGLGLKFCFGGSLEAGSGCCAASRENKILITTQLLMSLSDEFFTVSSPTLIRNMEIVKQGGN